MGTHKFGVWFLALSSLTLHTTLVWASPDVITHYKSDPFPNPSAKFQLAAPSPTDFSIMTVQAPITPTEIYKRTMAVLAHLKINPEPSYQKELDALNGRQSESGIARL